MPGGTGRRLRAVPKASQGPFDNYDPKLKICRGESHDFPYGTPEDHYGGVRGPRGKLLYYERELQCRRCGVKQIDTVELNGDQRRRMKGYPPGYRLSRDQWGHVGRREARVARLQDQLRRAAAG